MLNAAWSLAGVLSGETITVGPPRLWLGLAGAVLVGTPAFYYALFRELTDIRATGPAWDPAVRWWVGGGSVLSVAGAVAFLNPFTHYVAALYLLRRYRTADGSRPL